MTEEPLSMDQAFIKKLTGIILANLSNENFGAEELAKEAGMSRVHLYRRLQSIKKKDIVQFIREVRLHRAMEMLENSEGSVSEITYRVGFGSPAYFTRCFHEYYGFTPGEVKRKERSVHDPFKTGVPSDLSSGQETVKEPPIIKKAGKISFRKKIIVYAGIAAGLVLIYFLLILSGKDQRKKGEAGNHQINKSIIVLPFKNLSDNQDNQYFADGIMEDILYNLGRIKDLRVASRTTAEQFRANTMTAKEIAAKLKVSYILEGSVQKQSDRIRVNVQLIDAISDQHLWSEKYERYMTDIFSIQSDIAFQIANRMEATLSSDEIERIKNIPTKSIEAYNLYLYGRHFLHKNPQEAILNKSIDYFKKSLKEDPSFALSYAGMARAYMYLAHYGLMPVQEGRTRAKELATKALKIDNDIADAHSILGTLARYEFKWEEAIKEFRLAIDKEPDNPTAHEGYAMILFSIGRLDEAREQINLAVELDPLSLEVIETSALFYLNEGKIDEMGYELGKMKEIDSTNNHVYRLYSNYYILKGDTLNAIRNIKKACETDPAYSKLGIELMNINSKSGYQRVLELCLDAEIEKKNPIFIAAVCLGLDRKDEALNWLESACEERHSMIYNIYYAWPFRTLRSEPRFRAIIKKMGLQEYVNSSSAGK